MHHNTAQLKCNMNRYLIKLYKIKKRGKFWYIACSVQSHCLQIVKTGCYIFERQIVVYSFPIDASVGVLRNESHIGVILLSPTTNVHFNNSGPRDI